MTLARLAAALAVAAHVAALVAAPAARAAGGAETPTLGPLEVALLYHQRSRSVAPEDKLVSWFGEVCGEKEPAARAEAKKLALAPLRTAAHEASFTTRWRVPVRQTLGGYDVTRGGFPTSFRAGSVVRFGPNAYCHEDLSYLLVFENGDEHGVVALAKDRALDFVRTNPSREVVHELEVEVVSAQREPAPALVVRIVRMKTVDARRQTLVADSRR